MTGLLRFFSVLVVAIIVLLGASTAGASTKWPTITAELVCKTRSTLQGAVKAVWSPEKCERVAYAFSTTPWPFRVFSIAAIESGMDDKAVAIAIRATRRKGGVPVVAEHAGERRVPTARAGDRYVVDAGLLGIRCVLGPRGVCSNLWVTDSIGTQHSIRLSDLLVAEVNIAVGTAIIREKIRVCGDKWANCYNGNPSGSKDYGGQIATISAALGGFQIQRGSTRIRAIAKRILNVVFSLRRS